MSARVWLCTTVNKGMSPYMLRCLEQFSNKRVSCQCGPHVYVTARRWTVGNFCHTVDTCTACLQCGFSCEYLDHQIDGMPFEVFDIRTVFLQCALSCALLDVQSD